MYFGTHPSAPEYLQAAWLWQWGHSALPKSTSIAATGFLCARLDVVSRLSRSGGFDGQINERGCLREVVSEGCGGKLPCEAWPVAGFPGEPGGDRAGQAGGEVMRGAMMAGSGFHRVTFAALARRQAG